MGAPQSPMWRWRWHGWANALVLAWMAVSAALAAAAAAGWADVPAWLGVHTLLLGAVTTAIVVWGEHFAVAVTHAPAPDPRRSATRLGVLTAGQLSVVIGVIAELTWLLAAGASIVVVAIAAHAVALWRMRRRGLGGRLRGIVDYYLAACVCLLAGAVLGGLLGSGLVADEPWHSRVRLAHLHLNIGGWVLLTVVGTLFMLLPTTLRTLMDEGTQQAMRWCLGLAGPGLAVTVGGILAGSRVIAAAGLATCLGGLGVAAWTFAKTLARKRPNSGPSWMLTAAVGWMLIAAVTDLVAVAWPAEGMRPGSEPGEAAIGPLLFVGVIAQVLIGSLTYLLPVVLGGGPAATRETAARLDRWWPARLALLNASAAVFAVGLARVGWLLAAIAAADFLVRAGSEVVSRLGGDPTRRAAMAGAGAGVVVTVFAVLLAVSGTSTPTVEDGGSARVVEVVLDGMRVSPSTINVAQGTNLTLKVSNVDSQPHDLRTGNGKRTALLRKGETALLPVGRVTGDISAWCTVAGHRAAGMRLTIKASGNGHEMMAADGFSPGFKPHQADLPPAPAGQLHRLELSVIEKELEVAPGVKRKMWTFNGSAPGPTLRGRIGDVFEVTLVNNGSLGHGIDFHAGALAPDGPMRTIQPGERLVYRFQAERAGVWMYHCSTAPMTQHIGGGMFGAVIIDPPDLAPVAREYVLVSSELYQEDAGSDAQAAKLSHGTPDGWAFNGVAGQYDRFPLAAKTGERVRLWLLNAGPGGLLSFHMVGTQFDTVYQEGAYLLRPSTGGAQSVALAAAQGGFVEMVFPEAGHYALVDHDMRHAEGGAHGIVAVG